MPAHHHHHQQSPRRRRRRGPACSRLTRGAGYLLSGGLLAALFVSGRLHVQQSVAHSGGSSSSGSSSSSSTQQLLLQQLYHGPGPAAYGPLAVERPAEAPRPHLRGGSGGVVEGEAAAEAAAAPAAAGGEGARPPPPRRRRRYLAIVPLKGLKPTATGQRGDDDNATEEDDGDDGAGVVAGAEEGGDAPTRLFRDRSTPAAAAAGGPSRASLEVERLTLKTWDALAEFAAAPTTEAGDGDDAGVELSVFGVVEDAAHCDAALLAGLPRVTCLPVAAACRHPEFGIMTVDCILRAAWAQGHAAADATGQEPPDVYILANGDVLFTPTLLDAIGLAYDTFVDGNGEGEGRPATPPPTAPVTEEEQDEEDGDATAAAAAAPPPTPAPPLFIPPGTKGFALVGRRLDLNVSLPTRPEDPPLTEASLLDPGVAVRVHQATGIDYFAFTPDAFPREESNDGSGFPPYLIGRWRWDNALLLHFLLRPGVTTVDGSEVVHALHLGMSDSSGSKQHQARAGGRYNDALAASTTGRAHALGRIDATAYVLRAANANASDSDEGDHRYGNSGSSTPPRQQQPRMRLERRGRTMGAAQLTALRLAGGRGAGLVNAGVTVLPVPSGQVGAALEWLCWARARGGGAGRRVLLLAAEKGEAEALAAAMGGLRPGGGGDGDAVVHLHPNAISIKGGAGGNMQYYRDKKTGRASRAAMELGTAHVVQRLLRLNLTVTVADLALRWNRDPTPLLLGAGGECDLVMLDAAVPAPAPTPGQLARYNSSNSSTNSPLYLLRPSLRTAREWRRVLACVEDTIKHPKRYAPGFSCVRARLVDGVVGLEEEDRAEDDEDGGKEKEGGGDEDGEDGMAQRPWRACLVDPRASGSWFPTRASLVQQRGRRGDDGLSTEEPWGVLDDDGDAGGEEGIGGGRLWDAGVGQCVGAVDGWLASALGAPPLYAEESRE